MSDESNYEVVPVPPAAPTTLLGLTDVHELIGRATEIASALADVVRKRRLSVRLRGDGGPEYVMFEGWTLLGRLCGVSPITIWSRRLPDGDGWEARVEARTLSGQVVGAAEAMCSPSERNWSARDDYALRSMAITRASAKALRMPLGWVMTLAGYEATPAEEMDAEAPHRPPRPPARAARRAQPPVLVPDGPEVRDQEHKALRATVHTVTDGAVVLIVDGRKTQPLPYAADCEGGPIPEDAVGAEVNVILRRDQGGPWLIAQVGTITLPNPYAGETDA